MEKQKNPFKIQYFLALFVLCIGAFLACKNDMVTDDYLRSSTQPSTSIAKFEGTKTWFEGYLKSAALETTSKYRQMKPIWEQAKMINNHIEVPFTIDNKMGIPTINDGLKRVGKQFLLIGNPASPKKGYIVNIMPTLDFKGDMKNITLDNYRKEGFSGLITVRNLNGQAMEGVEYKNGKFKSKLKARSNDTKSLQIRQTCEWKEELYDCGTVCVGGYCGEPQCSSRIYFDCWDDDDDGGGDGDGDPCLGFNPPLYCSGEDDPCNGPNPPPNCGGIGDTDPCNGPNPPADCACNDETLKSHRQWIGTKSMVPFGYVEFFLLLSQVNVRSGSYTYLVEKTPKHSNPGLPGIYSFTDEGIDEQDNFKSGCTRIFFLRNFGLITVQQEEKGYSEPYSYMSNWSF